MKRTFMMAAMVARWRVPVQMEPTQCDGAPSPE
jgi:hypothetical protein